MEIPLVRTSLVTKYVPVLCFFSEKILRIGGVENLIFFFASSQLKPDGTQFYDFYDFKPKPRRV